MKKNTYLDSEGNIVDLPDSLAKEIEEDSFVSLTNFARILCGLFAVTAGINFILFLVKIAEGETALATVSFAGVLLNLFFCVTWFLLTKKCQWAFKAAKIQSYICLAFIPVGTVIGWFALKRLGAAHDSFCDDLQKS